MIEKKHKEVPKEVRKVNNSAKFGREVSVRGTPTFENEILRWSQISRILSWQTVGTVDAVETGSTKLMYGFRFGILLISALYLARRGGIFCDAAGEVLHVLRMTNLRT